MHSFLLLIIERARRFGALWILFGLCSIAMGCDGSGQSAPAPVKEDGRNNFSIRWHEPEDDPEAQPRSVAKSAIAESCRDIGIETVEIVVYDEWDERLETAGGPWPCTQGEGQAMSIPPGAERHFVVLGRDNADNIVYHGTTTMAVEPGQKTSVSIDAFPFGLKTVRKEESLDTQIDIAWSNVDDRADIFGYKIYSADNTDPIGNSAIEDFSHTGLFALTEYCYQVSAYDVYNNESKKSEPLCLKTTIRITDTDQGEDFNDEAMGDDADYHHNAPSYTKLDANGNDLAWEATDWVMVKDNLTGLIWEVKATDGGIRGASKCYPWESDVITPDGPPQSVAQYIEEINALEFGGLNEWRLPTKFELISLLQSSTQGRAINVAYFKNAIRSPYNWWTSTPYAPGVERAWYVNFGGGHISYANKKDNEFLVRAVHGKKRSMLLEASEETVTDRSTGLMWARLDRLADSAFRDQHGVPMKMSWIAALNACENLDHAGYNDWRMPNLKEMLSIVRGDKSAPALDTRFFTGMPREVGGNFWSSTTATTPPGGGDPGLHTWNVTIYDGRIDRYDKTDETYVLPVRTVVAVVPHAE